MTMDGIKTPMGTLRPGMIAANLDILGGWKLISFLISKTPPKEIAFAFFFLDFCSKQNAHTHLTRWLPNVTNKKFGNSFPWHHVLRLLPGYLTRLGKAKGCPTCWWLGTTKHSGKLKSLSDMLCKLCILALFHFYWRHAWNMPSFSTNTKHDETPRQNHPRWVYKFQSHPVFTRSSCILAATKGKQYRKQQNLGINRSHTNDIHEVHIMPSGGT